MKCIVKISKRVICLSVKVMVMASSSPLQDLRLEQLSLLSLLTCHDHMSSGPEWGNLLPTSQIALLKNNPPFPVPQGCLQMSHLCCPSNCVCSPLVDDAARLHCYVLCTVQMAFYCLTPMIRWGWSMPLHIPFGDVCHSMECPVVNLAF